MDPKKAAIGFILWHTSELQNYLAKKTKTHSQIVLMWKFYFGQTVNAAACSDVFALPPAPVSTSWNLSNISAKHSKETIKWASMEGLKKALTARLKSDNIKNWNSLG